MKVTKVSGTILNNQRGFTLIELIMVIVILGILAVVAIPKYQDIQTEARLAAANGVYGAMQAATAINYAARLVKTTKPTMITTGATLVEAMEGGLPDGWQISANTLCTAASSTPAPSDCSTTTDYIITLTAATAGPPETKATLVRSGGW